MGCTPVCFRDKTNECQFKGKRNLVDKNWGETAINEMPNEEVFDIVMLIIFCFKFINYVFSCVHEEGGQLKDLPCICKHYQALASSRPKWKFMSYPVPFSTCACMAWRTRPAGSGWPALVGTWSDHVLLWQAEAPGVVDGVEGGVLLEDLPPHVQQPPSSFSCQT